MAPARYNHEAMALAARDDVVFDVDIRTVDAETFEDAVAYNTNVPGMVGTVVRNDPGELLVLDHRDYGGWVMPGGRIDPGESLRAAARRETREESGVEVEIVRPLLVLHFVPRHDGRSTDNFLTYFECRAVDPEPATDLGEADEDIREARWTDTVPSPRPADPTWDRTYGLVTEWFEGITLAE